jgi:protein-S-isoprenylcysteine O-methyltransferase Ste14
MLFKTIAGFVQLIAIMALLLFAPAWTLHYWQAWNYLAVFGCSSFLITVDLWLRDRELLERRLKAGPGAETRKRQNWIQALASLSFLALLLVPSLDRRFGWSQIPVAVVIAGDLLVAAGFFVVYRVFRENTFTAGTIEIAEQQTAVSTGPYAVVRHPMYAGALILLLGTPLALGSWWDLLSLFPMTAVLVARLLDEEEYLARGLRGYREYCQKVRFRLLPFVW